MNRKKKIAIIIGAILIIYALIGFVAVPMILESMLPGKISEALNRPVSIKNIRLNPFALTVEIDGLDIKDKNATDPFASFDRLFVNIQTMSLFKLGLVVSEVRLEKPDFHLVRTAETGFNFSDLIPEKKPAKKAEEKTNEPEADKKPFRFSVSNIAIINGSISLQDDMVQGKHVLSSIHLTLPHISNFDQHIDMFAEPLLTGDFDNAKLSIDIDTKPFHGTIETNVEFSLSGISIPYYFAYVPKNMVGFKISNGHLDVDARVSYLQKNNQPEVTVQGTIGLSGLDIIEGDGSTVLKLPDLKIDVAPSRPLAHELTLASVKIESPELSVSRNADGIINLTTLGPKPAKISEPAKDTEKTPTESTPDSTAPENPFILTINEFLLDAGKISYADFAAAKKSDAGPVEMSVDDLVIKVSNFTNAPDKTAAYDIHARINKEANIAVSGKLGVTPILVDTDFSLSDLKLAWGQPYIPDNVQLLITGGQLAASGHAAVQPASDGKIQTNVTGKAAITGFDSLDSARKETFVAWNTFSLDGIDVSTHPLKINMDKILLKDFKNQFIIFNDKVSNIQKIFVKPESPDNKAKPSAPDTPENQAATPVIPVKIGEVILENGNLAFNDQSIEPHFSTRMNLTELRVTGLTSDDFKAADLEAKGNIDAYAPVKMKGKINPLTSDLFLDITYSLSNLELSPLSPYSGKYIGRMIEKGKLSSDVAYKIDKKAITAQNRILLDQFTLGKNVNSPDAVKLPLGVAIALLKDRNGQINIDLPISGRTDDPNFAIGKPLLNALQNLIVKAATSPFDLVSSIVGGGEELRYIEFAAATSTIDDTGTQKLDTVKKLMFERPVLKLDISGYVDMEADKAALKDLMLARKIKTRSLKKGSPQDIAVLDKMVLSLEEYQKLLKQAYDEEIMSDPEKNKTLKAVNDPSLTIEEMESIIRGQMTVTDDELRRLAMDRAQGVKNFLLQDGSVSADRLFLSEPDTLSPAKKAEFKAARVELNVR